MAPPGKKKDKGTKKAGKGKAKSSFVDTRFKFKSSTARLNDIVSTSSNLASRPALTEPDALQADDDVDDGPSSLAQAPSLFAAALAAAALTNLSAAFQHLHKHVAPLSRTLPLLVHHRVDVVRLVCDHLDPSYLENALQSRDEEAGNVVRGPSKRGQVGKAQKGAEAAKVKEEQARQARAREQVELAAGSVLSLLPAVIDDLSSLVLQPTEASSKDVTLFEDILGALLAFTALPSLDASLLDQGLQVIAHLFKALGKDLSRSATQFGRAWRIVRIGLGAPSVLPGGDEPRAGMAVEAVDDVLAKLDDDDDVSVESEEEVDEQAVEEGAATTEDDEVLPAAETAEAVEWHDGQGEDDGVQVDEDAPSRRDPMERHPGKTTGAQRRLLAAAFALVLRKAGANPFEAAPDGSAGSSEVTWIKVIFTDLVAVERAERQSRGESGLLPRKPVAVDRKGKAARKSAGEGAGSALVFAEGLAWLLVETCKSVEHRLHSKAPAVFVAVVQEVMFRDAGVSTLLANEVAEAMTVALLHHSRAEHFEPTLERLLDVAEALASDAEGGSADMDSAFRVLSLILGVRKGSRVQGRCRRRLLKFVSSNVPRFAADAPPTSPCASLLLAALCASMPGDDAMQGLVDVVFSAFDSRAAVTIADTLLARRQDLAPATVGRIISGLLEALDRDIADPSASAYAPRFATALLQSCAQRGNLDGIDWLSSYSHLQGRIASVLGDIRSSIRSHTWLDMPVEALAECIDWLSAIVSTSSSISTFTSIASQIGLLLTQLCQASDFVAETLMRSYESGPHNWPMLISYLLRLLGQTPGGDEMTSANFDSLLGALFWHRSALGALAASADEHRATPNGKLPSEHIASSLLRSLVSHDSDLRLSSLHLLKSVLGTSSESLPKIVNQCLKVEKTELSVAGARERGMHIRKLGILSASLPQDEGPCLALEIALACLIAQLKVPLQPVWGDAIQALSKIASKVPDMFWKAVWEQTHAATVENKTVLSPCPSVEGEPWLLEEATAPCSSPSLIGSDFRCPTVDRLRDSLLRDRSAERAQDIANAQRTARSLDIRAFESQCVSLLRANVQLAEKHNAVLVDLFLTICQPNDVELLGRSARTHLPHWLALLARFANPKALHRSHDVRSSCELILSDADASLRRLALDCLLAWRDPGLVERSGDLRNLLDTSKFRGSLLHLSSVFERSELPQSSRVQVSSTVIRLLYGTLLEAQKRSHTSAAFKARKTSTFTALRGCTAGELELLVDLMLRPIRLSALSRDIATRRYIGFLQLLGDVLKHIGSSLVVHWPRLLDVVLTLSARVSSGRDEDIQLDAGFRKVRLLCTKRLLDFFEVPTTFDFGTWEARILDVIVRPRLAKLAQESAQSPTPLLRLFCNWSAATRSIDLITRGDPNILSPTFAILSVPNVKPEVVANVLTLTENLLGSPEFTKAGAELSKWLPNLVEGLQTCLRRRMQAMRASEPVDRQLFDVLLSIAPLVPSGQQADVLCELMVQVLNRLRHSSGDRTAAKLLSALARLVPRTKGVVRNEETLKSLARLFEHVQSSPARLAIVDVLFAIAVERPDFLPVHEMMADLNSVSLKRVNEPDYDRRLAAYARLSADASNLGVTCRPFLLHHSFFQIRDENELSLRHSASELVVQLCQPGQDQQDAMVQQYVENVVLPAIRSALRARSDVLRAEAMTILGALVETSSSISDLQAMRCLSAHGNPEASFFNNVYHVQTHRRSRAIKRVGDFAQSGELQPRLFLDYFIPILTPIIVEPRSSADADVVSEAIRTLGRLSSKLNWSSYLAIWRQYSTWLDRPSAITKAIMRAIVSVLEFCPAGDTRGDDAASSRRMRTTMQSQMIPRLLRFMNDRHGADEPLRIMLGEGVGHLARYLDSVDVQAVVAQLTASLAQISKSLQHDVRIQARQSLARIAATLPPYALPDVIQGLRDILTRGPHLHVLSHTIHAILVQVSLDASRILDFAVPGISSTLGDDLFGQPARERESPEFRAKNKFSEVRSSRSFDTLRLLGERVRSSSIPHLLAPFKSASERTRSTKTLRTLDDGLRHLGAGLIGNSFLPPCDLAALVHALLSEWSSRDGSSDAPSLPRLDALGHDSASPDGRLCAFALDLLVNACRKGRFDANDPDIVGRLDPIVGLVGNTLHRGSSDITARSLRAMAELIKLPLPSVGNSAGVVVRRMLAISLQTGTSDSDIAQSAIRTLASVIRSTRDASLTESQLDALMDLIEPDLDDPDRQMTLFALLRAILSRGFVTPRLYDVMSRVSQLLVTSPSAHAREIARSAYLQFLIEYPQGKGRLRESLQFLADNLAYPSESGRLSVLELFAAVFKKFSAHLIDTSADAFFASLVLAVANESSPRCREMALEVFKVLLECVGRLSSVRFVKPLISWAEAPNQSALRQAALLLLGTYVAVYGPEDRRQLELIHHLLATEIASAAHARHETEGSDDVDVQLIYRHLHCLQRVHDADPAMMFVEESSKWATIRQLLLFPHTWVRSVASRLIGSLFAAEIDTAPSTLDDPHPLSDLSIMDLASKSSQQLGDANLDGQLALQIVKNLVTTLRILRQRQGSVGSSTMDKASDDPSVSDGNGHPNSAVKPSNIVRQLSRQVTTALQARPSIYAQSNDRWSVGAVAVLRCFAAIIDLFKVEDVESLLYDLLLPLYRINENSNLKDPEIVELQSLATEVLDLVRAKVDAAKFSSVHNDLRTTALERRQRRKNFSAKQAVTNPDAEARRRANRADAKMKQRKRKNAAFAQLRALDDGAGLRKKARIAAS